MEKYITYEEYGAAGDGIQDDLAAIIRAHEAANAQGLPVRARSGAVYRIADDSRCAFVRTDTDWTGAKFIIDDTHVVNRTMPVFHVTDDTPCPQLRIDTLVRGQDRLANPTGQRLYVQVQNENHMDYIRYGLNQNNGCARRDCFVVEPDGRLDSPVSFDFDEITRVECRNIPARRLRLSGGEFTTIANQGESQYNYHSRNVLIERSNVELGGLVHRVTGELDHGAPYTGFVNVVNCADVDVHDCLLTAHKIYSTIGAAGLPVSMGSYDISLNSVINVSFRRCRQTTDIMDNRYWGLVGSNFCRDLLFEDCVFSRFDAHMGVTNCTLRKCKLGWQCLNAIGNGTFLVEDTEAYGRAFINLRDDYGCTWHGDFIIRNCVWHPQSEARSIFYGHNPGTHHFGYTCYLPANTRVEGFTLADAGENPVLTVFNDWRKGEEEGPWPMVRPEKVEIRGVKGAERVALCEDPELVKETEFLVGE